MCFGAVAQTAGDEGKGPPLVTLLARFKALLPVAPHVRTLQIHRKVDLLWPKLFIFVSRITKHSSWGRFEMYQVYSISRLFRVCILIASSWCSLFVIRCRRRLAQLYSHIYFVIKIAIGHQHRHHHLPQKSRSHLLRTQTCQRFPLVAAGVDQNPASHTSLDSINSAFLIRSWLVQLHFFFNCFCNRFTLPPDPILL